MGISDFNSAFANNHTQAALLWKAHIAMAATGRNPAGKSTHRPNPTLGPSQNLTTETHSGLSECFFRRGVYLEYPAGLGLLRDAQKALVWVDLELTTMMC